MLLKLFEQTRLQHFLHYFYPPTQFNEALFSPITIKNHFVAWSFEHFYTCP
jgi:hypothetical protein